MTSTEKDRPLRVFVAGGSGAVGRALLPKLVDRHIEVTAMTRTPGNEDLIRDLGAIPVVCDVFDSQKLMRVVAEAKPDVVVNQLTELPKGGLKPKKLGEVYARNNRVRSEGTENLLAAARAAGAHRYIGQSIAFWYAPQGGMEKSEPDPLWLDAPSPIGEAVKALMHSEQVVLGAEGIEGVILRYGTFYGPNTWFWADGEMASQMKKGMYPIIGKGRGITSFIFIDDAAEACAMFVEGGEPGVYNIVDDDPATAAEWMPFFAKAVDARPPRRVPASLAKLVAGKGIVEWSKTSRGASNQKVKQALGWEPHFSSWRDGFKQIVPESRPLTPVS